MSETHWCWTFEAGSIQSYILETGRLADAVGASLLVDRLTGDLDDKQTGDLLGAVLDAAGTSETVSFSRRGGGVFIAFFDDRAALVRTRALWHLALRTNAPGLRWADGIAQGDDAKQAASAALDACQVRARFDIARLPEASPAALRVARTGQPAAVRRKIGEKGIEALDFATVRRREHGARRGATDSLLLKFSSNKTLIWPRNMDANDDEEGDSTTDRFPLLDGDSDVAFVHADGNGLGVLLRKFDKVNAAEYRDAYAGFSAAVSSATVAAAAAATKQVLEPLARPNPDGTSTMPARPLVLGGDDLTLIVRADLALPFAIAFLQAFEVETKRAMTGIRINGEPMPGLTAACGVAVVKSSYPFPMAAELAEHLCARAKRMIKTECKQTTRSMPLSALALQRVTTALADGELPKVSIDGRSQPLGHEAYVLDPLPGDPKTALPRWADLEALSERLGGSMSPRGPARQLLIDLYQGASGAEQNYARWRELRAGEDAQALAEFDEILQELGVAKGSKLPLGESGSPWPDALLVAELGRKRTTDKELTP